MFSLKSVSRLGGGEEELIIRAMRGIPQGNTCKQTFQQTDKHADKQADKQAVKQADIDLANKFTKTWQTSCQTH